MVHLLVTGYALNRGGRKQGGKYEESMSSVDIQKCPFCEVFKNIEQTLPLCSSRRDGKKTYIEHLIRSLDEGVMPPRKDAPLSGLPTQVGTSNDRDF
jgi:hypothetical protein